METKDKLDLLDKIASETENIISNSIKNRGTLSNWQTLQAISTMEGRKDDWIPELVKNLISSLQIFRDVEELPGMSNFMTNCEAKIDIGEGPTQMILSVRSEDDALAKSLGAAYVGGESGAKDEDGKAIIIDKQTKTVNPEDVQEAADKLTAFFVRKLEAKFNGEK